MKYLKQFFVYCGLVVLSFLVWPWLIVGISFVQPLVQNYVEWVFTFARGTGV